MFFSSFVFQMQNIVLICRFLLEKAVVSNAKSLFFLKNDGKEIICQERYKKDGSGKAVVWLGHAR